MAEKEYIEREAVIQKLNEICGCDASDDWEKGWDKAIDMAVKTVEKLPAADVAPVKHGHWIFKKRTKLVSTGIAKVAEDGAAVIMKKHITVKVPYCSICGERGDNEGDATPFCPNCGARMDGDADANGNDNKTPET